MTTRKRLTAREAMAIARFRIFNDYDWSIAHPETKSHHKQFASSQLRNLRRLGFSILPTPPRRGRGKR